MRFGGPIMRTSPLNPASASASASSQRGAATLFVTIVLLLAVGLITLYTNRSAILEQRLSANEVRAKQALEAANAGIEHALAYLREGGKGYDHDGDGVADTITSFSLTSTTGTNPRPSYYKAVFCSSAAFTPPVCPASHTGALACAGATPTSPLQLVAISCGWSDDDASVQRVVQVMQTTPALAGPISTPLVTRGAANLLTGGASILNYFNDLTVWSGGSLLGQSNTGKTFIRDIATNSTANLTDPYRATGNSPACLNPPAGYQCSTQGSTLGHDTVGGDTNLASLSPAGFFQYFFGATLAGYRDSTAGYVVDLTSTLTAPDSTSLSSISGMNNRTIWVEAVPGTPISLPGNIGTADKPVVLIINGDLNLSSNIEINGLVYVQGNITGNGSPTIYGALIGAGNATANGNLKLVYDPKVLGKAPTLGKAGKVQGSWRDW